MGHVPSAEQNVAKVNGDNDLLRPMAKSNLMTTVGNDLPGYSGHKPKSIYNDTCKAMAPDLSQTTSGRFSAHVASDAQEKAMNQRDHAKSHATKSFFTRGGGEDTSLVSDMFFAKYRPYDGRMKHGTKQEQKWVSEVQLKKSVITKNT
jgi:hypothetical protein